MSRVTAALSGLPLGKSNLGGLGLDITTTVLGDDASVGLNDNQGRDSRDTVFVGESSTITF